MRFTKMHGLGNDYVYVNCFKEQVDNAPALSRYVSDRHFGVGSDGLILICPSGKADFRMDMYNADGSQAEMCGNGIRCVAKYVYDYGLTDQTEISVETLAGIKYLKLTVEDGKVSKVRVNMGEPILDPALIPVNVPDQPPVRVPIEAGGKKWEMTCVSMGNPHAVVFIDSVKKLNIDAVGPCFENHPLFPRRTNTEFVEVLDRHTVNMRVWERGSGETLACGTGCCATVVACILNGLTDSTVNVHVLGGIVTCSWNGDPKSPVIMEGPATTVFEGVIEV